MQANVDRSAMVDALLSDLVLSKLSAEQALTLIQFVEEDDLLSKELDVLIALERFVALEGDSLFGLPRDGRASVLRFLSIWQ